MQISWREAAALYQRSQDAKRLRKEEDERIQAEALSKVGIFSTRSTEGAQAMALQFGLTGEKTKELITIVEDFAARKHIDPLVAMSEVLKSTTGKMGADLKELHIVLKKGEAPTKMLADVMEQLKEKVGGANEQIAQMTTAGQLANLNNQFEELKETIGRELVAALVDLKPYIISLFDHVKEGVKWIKANKDAIKEWAEALLVAYGVLKGMEILKAITAFVGLTTAVEGATSAQVALNAAAKAFPTAILATGIALIAKGAIDMYNLKKEGGLEDKAFNGAGQDYMTQQFTWMQAERAKLMKNGMSEIDAGNKAISEMHDSVSHEMQFLSKDNPDYQFLKSRYDTLLNTNDLNKVFPKLTKGNPAVSRINQEDPSLQAPDKKETVRENITINITKLVETLSLHSVTLKEGTAEIQEIIANTLQQAVYGVKLNYK